MISKRSIERVLETAKVEDVISNFVNLKKRGVNFIGLCPFHDEKTPSFTVSPSKNIYKCFGCGRGGGAVNFVMEHEGYSFIEAVKYLAQMYHIELEEIETSDEQKEEEQKRDSLFIINEWAKKRFTENLFNTQEGKNIGLAYFKERGFRENIIKKFDLGYAKSDPHDLKEAANAEGYNQEYCQELGLVSAKGYDFFRNRVMFTIHNLTGKPIGFAGRIMGTNPKMPKYINSPESEIYNKRNILYGLYFAKNEIRKLDYCILVEGYTDVLSMVQSGIENVVASSGTSLTTEQIRLIKRYTNTIKILYDGDAAGINAALRGMDMILAENMIVKLVILPENHDPDSFIKEVGPTEFLNFVQENEKDFILFKTNMLLQETSGDPVKKATILKEIVATLSKVPDPIVRSMYIKECSIILDVQERILTGEINKLIKKEIRERNLRKARQEVPDTSMEVIDKTDNTVAPTQVLPDQSDEYQEREVIRVLFDKGDKYYDEEDKILVVDYILSEVMDMFEFFENELYKKIILFAKEIRDKGKVPGEKEYLNADQDIREKYIELTMVPYEYADWPGKGMELQTQKHPDVNQYNEANQGVLRLRYKKLGKLIKANRENLDVLIKNNDLDNEDFARLIKIHSKLVKDRKKIAKMLNIVIA